MFISYYMFRISVRIDSLFICLFIFIFTSYHTRHMQVRTGQKAGCSEPSLPMKSHDAEIICAIEQPN